MKGYTLDYYEKWERDGILDKRLSEIKELVSKAVPQVEIAKILGMSEKTMYKLKNRYPKMNQAFVFGEVTTTAKIDYADIAKQKLKEIGYEDEFVVMEKISKQSVDIALGVNSTESHEQGAGDQGIMFGYACNETQEFMPLPIMLANQISKEMDKIRKEKYSHIFGPDGKCQVSVAYKNGKPKKV